MVRPKEKSPTRNVKYFKIKQDIAINEVEVNQSVYVYKCEGSSVKVNGKCIINIIIINRCCGVRESTCCGSTW